MPTYRCPLCKSVGENGSRPTCAFENRGREASKPVFKCRKCGVGLLKLGMFSKKLTAIPPHEWAPMEHEWYTSFPEDRGL